MDYDEFDRAGLGRVGAGVHFASSALHDHRFGALGHSLIGLLAGALSGYFLQLQALQAVGA
jgi:hypothetical protein